MSKGGKKRDFKRSLGRRPASREPRKSILIVVEGHTEELYFKKYKNDFHLRLIDIEPHVENPPCTDPISLVSAAKELMKRRKQDAGKSYAFVDYDEVWVVYDLEKVHDERRPQSNQAKQQTQKEKIQFAISDPSFEFWYILHFEKTTKSFNNADEVERHLKRHFPNYKKATPPSQEIIDRTDIAIENAKWVREQLERSQSTAPITNVDQLVISMRNM